jgi:hypothetical protein
MREAYRWGANAARPRIPLIAIDLLEGHSGADVGHPVPPLATHRLLLGTNRKQA